MSYEHPVDTVINALEQYVKARSVNHNESSKSYDAKTLYCDKLADIDSIIEKCDDETSPAYFITALKIQSRNPKFMQHEYILEDGTKVKPSPEGEKAFNINKLNILFELMNIYAYLHSMTKKHPESKYYIKSNGISFSLKKLFTICFLSEFDELVSQDTKNMFTYYAMRFIENKSINEPVNPYNHKTWKSKYHKDKKDFFNMLKRLNLCGTADKEPKTILYGNLAISIGTMLDNYMEKKAIIDIAEYIYDDTNEEYSSLFFTSMPISQECLHTP